MNEYITIKDGDEIIEASNYGLDISEEGVKHFIHAYSSYSDEGLTKMWNRFETKKLTPDLELTMDWIEKYLYHDRGVVAWNHKGEVTIRVNIKH